MTTKFAAFFRLNFLCSATTSRSLHSTRTSSCIDRAFIPASIVPTSIIREPPPRLGAVTPLHSNLPPIPRCRFTALASKMSSVDTSLHPHTSGLAAITASSHSGSHPLKLWAGWFCPFVQRAWIVLQEKKIDYQYHEVNPYKKEKDFLEVNPRGLVPTLECPRIDGEGSSAENERGRPLIESTVICEYLDDVYSDVSRYGKSLLPADAYDRARCRVWIDLVGTRLVPSFYRMLQHQPDKPYSIEEARADLLGHLKTFVKEMGESGPWFLGDRFSMVDVSIAPWVLRLFLIEHYKPGGLGLPTKGQGGEDEAVWERWRTFAEAIEARQSIKETMSEREQYIDAYKRYAEDKAQSGVAQATRSGRNLP